MPKTPDDAPRTLGEIQRVFEDDRAGFAQIFRRAEASRPDLAAGKVVVSLTIAPDGHVSETHLVSSTYQWPALENTVLHEVRDLRFAARSIPEFTYPDYPLKYSP